MFVVPIWLNNLVWFACFMMATLQLYWKEARHPVLNLQMFVMVVSIIAMCVATLSNHDNAWLTIGIFVAGIVVGAYMYRLFRYMPLKPEI